MLRILAAAAAFWAAFLMPAFGQQIVCVPDTASADEAARHAGEELALELVTSGGTPMRLYIGTSTFSVFFEREGTWCTAPSMVGEIKRDGAA